MPGGRPTDYKPEYCQTMIDLMSQGYSYAAVAAELNVCRDTLDDWAARNPEFLRAKRDGNDKRITWWERHARAKMTGESKASDTVLIFMLKNAAKDLYGDQQTINQTITHNVANVDVSKLNDEQLSALKNATVTKLPG